MTIPETEHWLDNPSRRALIMGVLNVTPDSFSDAGRFLDTRAALERATAMLDDGADWVDVGGESTRPGSDPVEPREQLRRVLPVIEGLRETGATLSIDTSSAAVAEAALDAGAALINDITAGTGDRRMVELMPRARAVILMHMQGTPATMQQEPRYKDVVAEVEEYLLRRAEAVEKAGVERRRILIDPGIGFGKNLQHNLQLLRELPRLAGHGYPVLVGPSRKRFIGTITGVPIPERRQFGTAAAVAWSIMNGAVVARVHDTAEMRQVRDVLAAIRDARAEGGLNRKK
jgi:dihydropteroate synthase